MKLFRKIVCVILLISLMAVGLFACKSNQDEKTELVVKVLDERFDLLANVIEFAEQNGMNGVDYDLADLYAAYGVINSLGNFNYINSLDSLYSTSSGGFGLIVKITMYNEIFIDSILPGSPFLQESNGVQPQRGDEIYAINGERVAGADTTYFSSMTAAITVNTSTTFTLRRAGVLLPDVTYTKVDFTFPQCFYINNLNGVSDDFGYILLRSFSNSSNVIEEFKQAVTSFNADNNKALILDLRGNGGGSSLVLSEIASYFVGAPTGKDVKLVEIHYTKQNKSDYIMTTPSASYIKTPIYVLTDGNTASASEALIGAMKAHGTLTAQIGGATVGKGVAQNGFIHYSEDEKGYIIDYITDENGEKVPDGAYLVQIVVGEYYIFDPNVEGGKYCMNGVPFVPDIQVSGLPVITTDYSEDLCIKKVIEHYNANN